MDALDDFYTDHPFVYDTRQQRTKEILNTIKKGSVFGFDY